MGPRIAANIAPMRISIAVVCLCLAACPRSNTGPSGVSGAGSPDAPPETAMGWKHKSNSLVVKLGSARHSAIDAIVNPGQPAIVRGKFAYGKVSKDLQGEQVWLEVQHDDRWRAVAHADTDGDGRVTLKVPAALIADITAEPIVYRFLVSGDLSTANGFIWRVARGQKAVLFDIDGTLTTGDLELVDDAFGFDIDVRKGAVDVVRSWADAGYAMLYLTGRPYLYNRSTRAWLDKHGFPHGPLATANSITQAIPDKEHVGAFKRDWLQALERATGVDIAYAYGNSSTDICAFAEAGIEPARTYIIGNDQKACKGFGEVNLIADYVQHGAVMTPPPAAP